MIAQFRLIIGKLPETLMNRFFLRKRLAATTSAGNRIAVIDTTRGILFLLMTSTHALTLANVAETSILKSGYWLPSGWATTSFIMLSGYTIAFVYPWQSGDYRVIRKRLYRRAKQILLVMFVSNIVMLSVHYMVAGRTALLLDLHWWLGLFTFRTEYSISAILLPTALLLLVATELYLLCDTIGTTLFTSMVAAGVFIIWEVTDGRHLPTLYITEMLFFTGISGFLVVPLLSLGVFGLTSGILVKHYVGISTGAKFVAILVAILFLTALVEHISGITNRGLICITRFYILFLIGACASSLKARCRALAFLSTIGKYALFSFVAHRLVLEGGLFLFEILPVKISPPVLYVALAVTTLLIITLLCEWRDRCPRFDAVLRKFYL
jgi:hypothetical protein